MSQSGHADRVILISIMKSGTHLIQELMLALGYDMYGHVRVRPEDKPSLDRETRWRLACLAYDDEELARLKAQDGLVFNDATNQAWEALAWSWQLRFGMPLNSWYSTELINRKLVQETSRRSAGMSFADTPENLCWVFHEFNLARIDGAFLREWAETGKPKIIFNYRDPRDTVLSMVNFLCGKTKGGLSDFNNLRVLSEIMLSKDTLEDRLTYALTDESFPCQARDFKSMLWLLHHPNVCKVSFEELVGPKGGGSAEAQLDAAARLIDFLGERDSSPKDIVDALFNSDAFSFFKGQIGGWEKVYTPGHRRIADDTLGEVLALYGYA